VVKRLLEAARTSELAYLSLVLDDRLALCVQDGQDHTASESTFLAAWVKPDWTDSTARKLIAKITEGQDAPLAHSVVLSLEDVAKKADNKVVEAAAEGKARLEEWKELNDREVIKSFLFSREARLGVASVSVIALRV
jgi:uncharacterized protein YdbL (DUF1318 family)